MWEALFSKTYKYSIKNFWSKVNNHKKIIVVVPDTNLNIIQKTTQDSNNQDKISLLKPETSPGIPFSNNSYHT